MSDINAAFSTVWTTIEPLPTHWRQIFRDVRSLAALRLNWDGYDATPPTQQVINRIMELLNSCRQAHVAPPCRVAASPAGSIVVEWRMNGTYREAEISDSPMIEWMSRNPDGTFEHWETPIWMDTDNESEYVAPAYSDSTQFSELVRI